MPFVYFIQAGDDDGPIKIGFAKNADQRLKELQTGNHLPLTAIARFEVTDAPAVEEALHRAFIDLRLEGEWFAFDERITAVIDAWHLFSKDEALRQKSVDAIVARMKDAAPVTEPLTPGNFAVEWSHRQRCIHIDEIDDVIDVNRQILLFGRGAPQDYTIVAIVGSYEDAHAVADLFEPVLRAVAILRAAGLGEGP